MLRGPFSIINNKEKAAHLLVSGPESKKDQVLFSFYDLVCADLLFSILDHNRVHSIGQVAQIYN